MGNIENIRICLIATELAGFGAWGGFGSLTWDIGSGLASRGFDIYVAMPRQPGQKPIQRIGGITVVSYQTPLYGNIREVLPLGGLYRMIDAHVYHSQEPSLGTRLAQINEPDKKHVITFQDPRNIEDWRKQWLPQRRTKLQEWKFRFRYQLEVGRAVRRIKARYCQAKYIIEKAAKIYHLNQLPGFLPNPIRIPNPVVPKAATPTVCFVGRWDPIKRPELFLDLAAKFPDVKFYALGASLNDAVRDAQLRKRCSELPNVEAPGWIGSDQRNTILGESWILINTSTKECLPVSYLEAAAHKCAILSHGNADDFANSFGYWAQEGEYDDFLHGLEYLLEQDRWKELGEKGYDYVENTHEFENVIDRHIAVYTQVLNSSN